MLRRPWSGRHWPALLILAGPIKVGSDREKSFSHRHRLFPGGGPDTLRPQLPRAGTDHPQPDRLGPASAPPGGAERPHPTGPAAADPARRPTTAAARRETARRSSTTPPRVGREPPERRTSPLPQPQPPPRLEARPAATAATAAKKEEDQAQQAHLSVTIFLCHVRVNIISSSS